MTSVMTTGARPGEHDQVMTSRLSSHRGRAGIAHRSWQPRPGDGLDLNAGGGVGPVERFEARTNGPTIAWISGLYPAMATRMPSVMTSAGVHPLPGGANGPVDDESIGAGHPVMMTKVMTSRPSSHRGQTRPRPGEHDQGGDEFTATRRALRGHPVALAIDDFSDDHR